MTVCHVLEPKCSQLQVLARNRLSLRIQS